MSISKMQKLLFYSTSHEWVLTQDNLAVCGISDYRQQQLGEIVFIELPEINEEIKSGDEVCVVESVKSISDIHTPISGIISAVNENLEKKPGLINTDPYTKGWMYKVYSTVGELRMWTEHLISPEEYRENYF